VNVGIIFIGTAGYRKFFDGFYEGIEKNFLRKFEKNYVVFTDDVSDSTFKRERVSLHQIEHAKWPFITLHRFKFINQARDRLLDFDYVFFVDADLWCIDEVGEEVLDELVGVQHPGFIGKIGTFETDTRSLANIFDGYYDLSNYWQGCLWGGKSTEFVKMVEELEAKVDEDYEKGIVAVWHDESHMNKYFLQRKSSVKTLHPGFAQPQHGYEHVRNNFPTKFVHLDKDMKEFPRFAGVR